MTRHLALTVLFRIEGRISFAFAIFAVIELAVLLRIRTLATPAAKNSMQTVASLYGYIGDCFAATEDLRSRGADGYVLHGLIRRLRDRLHASRTYTALYNLTLTRLLLRLYNPSEGVVRLGGIDLHTAAQSEICRQVALVTQEVQVFQGTVRDNLTFFDPAIPDTRILAALGELGLWPWYAGLPQGLDTELAAGGLGLSAGEAQLLAFARVFLRNPALIILDEASSRLDPATERTIERTIDRLLRGRTAIIVAHRLATVQRADEMLILADGRILEHVRREQLAHDPTSRFAGLLRTGLEVASA